MMLSNPPPSHIANNSEVPWTQAPPDIPIRHLMVLMDTASKIQLPRKGEITPVLALKRIRNDERYGLLTRQQFDNLTRLLQSKSRCYGYVVAIYRSVSVLTFTALDLFLRSSWWMTRSTPSLTIQITASALQSTLTTLALDVTKFGSSISGLDPYVGNPPTSIPDGLQYHFFFCSESTIFDIRYS